MSQSGDASFQDFSDELTYKDKMEVRLKKIVWHISFMCLMYFRTVFVQCLKSGPPPSPIPTSTIEGNQVECKLNLI